MANALVSMVVNKLREEVYLVGGAKVELQKLSSTFESIQVLLNQAEIMQFHDESMQVWLKNLKDVAYDVEDVLDEMIPLPEPESRTHDGDDRRMGNQPWACLFSVFSCLGLEEWIRLAHESWTDGDETDGRSIRDKVGTFVNKIASQRDFASQIKELRVKLDQIADDKNKFSFKENYSFRGSSELDKAESQTSSLVDESKMLGRDKDKDIIISKLVSKSSSEEVRIHVISITGVGGLGKTTLAQLICNDRRVSDHFNKVLWVCVSDDFNAIRLTKAIIEAAGGTSPSHSQLDSLQKELIETLRGKLFLLVLDDAWNDDGERWEKLWLSLQSGAQGSKILVTTRSNKVAGAMDAAYVHKLEGLSDDDCWSLFKSKAFARREMEDRRELEKMEEIGREIAKKCKGVPLSAKVIGSVMRSKRTAQDWQDILESETWEIPDIAKVILPALLVSYYNLPVHLKQCFSYCSIFPKDHELEKDRLVKLWLAQGFIRPQGRREIEAIGGEYFDELLSRSLFQDVVEHEGVIRCKMHDLLHDLAQFITKNECCIFEIGKSDSISVTTRHSSLIESTWETLHIPAPLCHANKLRTLLQIGGSVIDTIPDNLFHCARSLRTLDLGGDSGTLIKELPSSIELLKHLRYLDLSGSRIVELPESVTRLRNLQTLMLNYCEKLQRLPSGITAMVSLRHLEILVTKSMRYLPEGLGRINSVRLNRFMVGGDGGCKIGELKHLNSLQGKLVIENLERVSSVDEAKEAELENKLHLRELSLNALEMSGDGDVERMEAVFEALRPPLANLEELEIRGYIGSKFPTWLGDSSFSNLVKLRLVNCYNCTQLPGLGRLPSLEFLSIEGGLIKRVGPEFYGNSCGGGINREAFPKLEDLCFSSMNEWDEWEMRLEDRQIMPSLRRLEVYDCPRLKALPQHLPKSLTSLQIVGCNEISGMQCSLPLVKDFKVESSGGILWPLPNLPSLKTFQIRKLENTTCLPNGWEQLESLERITIRDCTKLRSLPDELGHLKSLRSLEIDYCPELRSLPQGLRGLTCLQDLIISGIPALAEKCTRKDWSKISHIPNIWIDNHKIK